MTEEEAREAWIRLDCLENSRKINQRGGLDKIIKDAKKIEQYALGRNPKNVIKLVKVKK